MQYSVVVQGTPADDAVVKRNGSVVKRNKGIMIKNTVAAAVDLGETTKY